MARVDGNAKGLTALSRGDSVERNTRKPPLGATILIAPRFPRTEKADGHHTFPCLTIPTGSTPPSAVTSFREKLRCLKKKKQAVTTAMSQVKNKTGYKTLLCDCCHTCRKCGCRCSSSRPTLPAVEQACRSQVESNCKSLSPGRTRAGTSTRLRPSARSVSGAACASNGEDKVSVWSDVRTRTGQV